MKELEKNLEATGGVPAEAELAAINRFAKSPLRAEEVYTFSLRLCDNEVDRDWERFDTAALNTLGDLFVGKSGIFDHQWTAEGQTARIYRTEMVREGAQVTAVGDGYCWLKACDDLAEGELVKVSANGTVAACAAGDDFCGMVLSVGRGGDACAVALGGMVTAGYTVPAEGAAPALGWSGLSADGEGGVQADADGSTYLVVDVDTTAKTVTFVL